MNKTPHLPELERPSFFEGQPLTAGDLNGATTFHRELRWLHNRSLHGWGVSAGLEVIGQPGETAVTVLPGFAHDCWGRELLLTEPQVVPIGQPIAQIVSSPPSLLLLTISYQEDDQLGSGTTRQGICMPGGAVRRPERSRLRWLSPLAINPDNRSRPGLDVILASGRVRNCRLAAPLSFQPREEMRSAKQPYVAAGATPEGNTPWSFWPDPQDGSKALGVETLVDTSAVGFLATPSYTAHVVGLREYVDITEGWHFVFEGFTHVHDPTSRGFACRVLMPRNLPVNLDKNYVLNPNWFFQSTNAGWLGEVLQWHVVWLGVEG